MEGQTDRQTDRILVARPRLHSMQHGNDLMEMEMEIFEWKMIGIEWIDWKYIGSVWKCVEKYLLKKGNNFELKWKI